MKSILILGATFGTDNMGVGALASGAVTILSRRYPHAEVAFLDYGSRSEVSTVEVDGRAVKVPLVNLRFSWKIFLKNNVAYLLALAGLRRALGTRFSNKASESNRWMRSICQADLAVAVSGGDSFSDIYGLGRFLYVYLPQLLVVLLGKKLVLLPQTIGPFKGTLARSLAAQLLWRAELVYSRDHTGVNETQTLLGRADAGARARFCYDMGFIVEPRKPKGGSLEGATVQTGGPRLLVGLNVSGLLLMGGYGGNNTFNLKSDYGTLIERTIEFLVSKEDADVVLVPHVFGRQDESDSVACARLHSQIEKFYPGRLSCLRGTYDQSEIKYLIGQCQFFIGARMHACIAALSQAVPAVGIAYSRKFLGVFESVGVGHLVADPRRLSIDQVLEVIARALRDREAIHEHLRKTMVPVRQALLTSLDEVK